jgi:hypothetical protein
MSQWPVIICIYVAGAYRFCLEFYPQKCPAYSGSTLAGFLLALAILSTTKVGTLVVCLGVPLVDTATQYEKSID